MDQALLRDLQSTEKLLREYGLSSTVAHALLGRTVFVKYLEDRRILLPDHFRQHGQAQEFKELLNDESGTRSFFTWLRQTFNGDLFPQTEAELQSVDSGTLISFIASSPVISWRVTPLLKGVSGPTHSRWSQ